MRKACSATAPIPHTWRAASHDVASKHVLRRRIDLLDSPVAIDHKHSNGAWSKSAFHWQGSGRISLQLAIEVNVTLPGPYPKFSAFFEKASDIARFDHFYTTFIEFIGDSRLLDKRHRLRRVSYELAV